MEKNKKKIITIMVAVGVFILLSLLFKSLMNSNSDLAPEPTMTENVVARVMATQTALAKVAYGDTATPSEVPTEETTAEPTDAPTTEPAADPIVEPTAEPTLDLSVPSTYTIHYGEHPFCLARRFDIDPEAILSVNGLAKDDKVNPGDVLSIPDSAGPYEGDRNFSTRPDTFTVLPMDTFYSIACYYGDVFPIEIAAANSMTIDEALEVGAVIEIP